MDGDGPEFDDNANNGPNSIVLSAGFPQLCGLGLPLMAICGLGAAVLTIWKMKGK